MAPPEKRVFKSKIRLRQSMLFTRKTVLLNFIPIRFETTVPWVCFAPSKKNKNKMVSDMRSVPDQ